MKTTKLLMIFLGVPTLVCCCVVSTVGVASTFVLHFTANQEVITFGPVLFCLFSIPTVAFFIWMRLRLRKNRQLAEQLRREHQAMLAQQNQQGFPPAGR